jgi:hypothetical protein
VDLTVASLGVTRLALSEAQPIFFPSQKNPKIRDSRSYYWIVVADSASEVVWQKLIPLAFGLTGADLSSVLATPQHNLLFTRHWAGQSEALSVNQVGELVAAKQLKGFYVGVHPMGATTTIQLFGGDPGGAKSLITIGEDMRELHREDGLDVPEFVAEKAYGDADSALLLVGEQIQRAGSLSAIRYVGASRQVTGKTLTHGSLFDAGSAKVSTLMPRSGEILIARELLERIPGDAKRLGITLDTIQTPKN